MSGQPSARLLVAYLATAVDEVRQHLPLSQRSTWAIEHASSQLQSERAALYGPRRSFDRRAAFVASATTPKPRVGALMLETLGQTTPGPDSGEEGLAALTAFGHALDGLRSSDPDAAERVALTITPIIDRLVSA